MLIEVVSIVSGQFIICHRCIILQSSWSCLSTSSEFVVWFS